MTRAHFALLPLPFLLLAACGATDNEPGPGGVTQSEARELNEAAEMLDANAIALDDIANGQDAE